MSESKVTNRPAETSALGNRWQRLTGFTEALLKQLTLGPKKKLKESTVRKT